MRIKTVKKMNLPELIQHVWDNEAFPSAWRSEESPSDDWTIQFFEDGMFRSYNGFHDYDTFNVEVEETLTQKTELPHIVHMYIDGQGLMKSENLYNESIFSGAFPNSDLPKSLKMYVPLTDGTLQLIWTKEHGIPESGVLEVDTE